MSMSSSNMRLKDIRPAPCEIEYKNMKFLITDRPTDQNIHNYIQELKKHKVKDVVRVCEPSYQIEELQNEGIRVTDLEFDDGTPPPGQVVEEWFELLKNRFRESPDSCVAVHCVAGLGRAPVMVALALIELGMKYEDAVEFIRRKRRGAINSKQLAYLEKYRPKSRLKLKNGHRNEENASTIPETQQSSYGVDAIVITLVGPSALTERFGIVCLNVRTGVPALIACTARTIVILLQL